MPVIATVFRPLHTACYRVLASCRMAAATLCVLSAFPATANENFYDLAITQPAEFPSLTFSDDQGNTYAVKKDKNKVTLVHIWATWCGPCVKEFPHLEKLQKDYGDKGLKIYAVSLDGPKNLSKILAFYQQQQIQHLPVYLDTGGEINKLRPRGMPTTYLINSDGKQFAMAEGAVDWSDANVRKVIEHYLDITKQ